MPRKRWRCRWHTNFRKPVSVDETSWLDRHQQAFAFACQKDGRGAKHDGNADRGEAVKFRHLEESSCDYADKGDREAEQRCPRKAPYKLLGLCSASALRSSRFAPWSCGTPSVPPPTSSLRTGPPNPARCNSRRDCRLALVRAHGSRLRRRKRRRQAQRSEPQR